MKKIILTSFSLIVFGLLAFVNSATATVSTEKPLEGIMVKIISPESAKFISGDVELIVNTSKESLADITTIDEPLVLIGKVSLLGSGKSVSIGENKCEIKSDCLISKWDTKEFPNGEYEIVVTDSGNKYSSNTIVITIENPIITDPNPPVDGGSDTTTPRRRSSSGSYLRNFSNNQGEGRVLGAEKFIFTLPLKLGSRGNEVTELHKRLIADGYLKITAPTGYFGPLTLQAVKDFQTAKLLVADGVVGPLTRAELNK